jgi:predicted XRE-type DNA-binding protein
MSRVKPIVAGTPEALAEALGLSPADAKEWQVRYALLRHLKEIVRKRKVTHAAIAELAGTSRTRVTAILNDKLDNVSSDLLIRILGSLGYRVRVTVSKVDSAAQPPYQPKGYAPEKPADRRDSAAVP